MEGGRSLRGDGERDRERFAEESGWDGGSGEGEAAEIGPSVDGRDDGDAGEGETEEVGGAVRLTGSRVGHSEENDSEAEDIAIGEDADGGFWRGRHGIRGRELRGGETRRGHGGFRYWNGYFRGDG